MLFDHLHPLKDAPRCPNEDCQAEMILRRSPRREDMTQTRLKYECPYCYRRMEITTRNNERIGLGCLLGLYVGMFAFLGGLVIDMAIRSGIHA